MSFPKSSNSSFPFGLSGPAGGAKAAKSALPTPSAAAAGAAAPEVFDGTELEFEVDAPSDQRSLTTGTLSHRPTTSTHGNDFGLGSLGEHSERHDDEPLF